ncbi:MAG: tRNA uridine-5-carboxymethylaminomethyl(34) synthesis GTPase MnmE [Clostridia bacterium]|nr:tRNA uridine-5-carboxymethylaminomethyl(34) synthesis GTPase MnmE [Clostridia bacterium]
MSEKTIAAISTPEGQGGIGVVRISGSQAFSVGDKVFKSLSGKKLSSLSGYTALFGKVQKDGEVIDEAVATVFRAPKSYTGEDVCEISCHGGRYVTEAVLRAVLEAGATAAAPGEFTKRAFLNGKMDLAQAESVAGLIAAKGEQELKLQLAAKDGRVSKEIGEIEALLLEFSSDLAAYNDYPDEDLSELDPENFNKILYKAKGALEKLLKNYDSGSLLLEGIRTAIVGKPNVGKSTLMNLLAGKNRSIVTEIAGTTRDIIEDTVRFGQLTLLLADTAGIRQTDDIVENAGVDLAKQRIENAQLVLAVFDTSTPFDDDDRQILELIKGKNCVVVLNKTDKGSVIDKGLLKEFEIVEISAKEGLGAEELQKAVVKVTNAGNIDSSAAVLVSRRQRDLAVKALNSVNEAVAILNSGMTLDAVGVLIDEALTQLYSIDGKRVTNQVADEVFRRFCVGK